jgi:6,7-dimethyl-8-ribityllumazine synthase
VECQGPKVAIKFCGLCTQYIDVSAVVRILCDMQSEMGFVLLPFSSVEEIVDVVVILSSCSIGCADRNDVRNKAAQTVVIDGEVVNGKQVSFDAVPEAVAAALRKALLHSASPIVE